MELEIELSELRKRKIFVATPMYGGQCHGMYTKSTAELAKLGQAYDVDIKLIYTKSHHTPAYPSGHTMYAALGAEMLKDLYPQYKDVFDNWIKDVGEARVLQGVHFPSDNQAAVKIIQKVYPYIKEKD